MKSVVLATVASFTLVSAAAAADLSAEIAVDVTKNGDENYVAETSIDLGVDAGIGVASIGLEAVDGEITVDTYSIGTTVGDVTVSYGVQGDLMGAFEGKTEAVGGTTLADLDDDGESIMVSAHGASLMLGFTDVSEDITDIKNVQVSYGLEVNGLSLAAGLDRNIDTEENTLFGVAGYTVSEFDLGATVTYNEFFAYEADVTHKNVTVFINGDEDDMTQNIGAGYYGKINDLNFYVEAAYNLDSEEFTPAAGVSFKF